MSVGRTNAIASQDKLFAVIAVTYPVGSILTCTDGTKTFKAKNKTGSWIFSVPYSGTWTVLATEGEKTSYKTVEISKENEAISVVLAFELVLYNMGNEQTSVTGGWQTVGLQYTENYQSVAPTVTNLETHLEVKIDPTGVWRSGAHITRNMIDLTNYNTLEVEGYGQWTDQYCGVDIVALPNLETYWSGHPRASVPSGTTNQKAYLDISECRGNYYIGIAERVSSGGAVGVITTLKLY